MSRVFVAEELRLQRKVVVKVLSPELALGLSAERFEREIRTVAALQQANIVPVLTAGDTDGLPFYTMPFVEGESLRAHLGRGPLAITEVVGIAEGRREGARRTRTSAASCIATSSRTTCCSRAARRSSPTSASRRRSARARTSARRRDAHAGGHVDRHAGLHGARAGRRRSRTSITAPTSTRSARWRTSCSPGHPVFSGSHGAAHARRAHERGAAPDQRAARRRAGDARRARDALPREGSGRASAERERHRARARHDHERKRHAGDAGRPARRPRHVPEGAGDLCGGVRRRRRDREGGDRRHRTSRLGVRRARSSSWRSACPSCCGRATCSASRAARCSPTPTYTPGGTPTANHGTMATMALKAAPHMSWYRTARGGMYAFGAFIAFIALFMGMRAPGIGPFGSLFAAGRLNANAIRCSSPTSARPTSTARWAEW